MGYTRIPQTWMGFQMENSYSNGWFGATQWLRKPLFSHESWQMRYTPLPPQALMMREQQTKRRVNKIKSKTCPAEIMAVCRCWPWDLSQTGKRPQQEVNAWDLDDFGYLLLSIILFCLFHPWMHGFVLWNLKKRLDCSGKFEICFTPNGYVARIHKNMSYSLGNQ